MQDQRALRHPRRTRALALFVGVTVVASFAACVRMDANPDGPEPSAVDTPKPARGPVVAFGGSFAYDDGVSIATSALTAHAPFIYTSGAEEGLDTARVTVTITNGSPAAIYPFVHPAASSAGLATEPLYGGVDQLGFTASSPIQPGSSLGFELRYSVRDTAAVTIPLAPNFTYQAVTFATDPAMDLTPGPRYVDAQGEEWAEDLWCQAWQSDTIGSLELRFQDGPSDPDTSQSLVARAPALWQVDDPTIERFKANAALTAPLPTCVADWYTLDYYIDLARRNGPLPTAPVAPAEGELGGGLPVPSVDGNAPGLDCWRVWKVRCVF
jgi:hypothetical protein